MDQPPWPDAVRGHWRGIINVFCVIDDVYIVYFWKGWAIVIDAHTASSYWIDNFQHDKVMTCESSITIPYTNGHERVTQQWYLDSVHVHDTVYYDDKFVVIPHISYRWIVFRPLT